MREYTSQYTSHARRESGARRVLSSPGINFPALLKVKEREAKTLTCMVFLGRAGRVGCLCIAERLSDQECWSHVSDRRDLTSRILYPVHVLDLT